jgi:hypothetical protein
MASQILIDQVGLSSGVAGQARTDGLDTGALVTVTNTGSGTVTVFQLLWVPPGDTTAVSSLAATGDNKIWTFSPTAGVYGTYLIQLVEDGAAVETRAFAVRTPRHGLVIPALNERGSESSSLVSAGSTFIEAAENNAVDF